MIRAALVIVCVLMGFIHVSAKSVEVMATLTSGEQVELAVKGYKKGLFSPSAKFKTALKKRIDISQISSFTLVEEETEFIVFKAQVLEDEGYVIATLIQPNLYKTIASYRPCTCNDNYRNVTAYIYEVNGVKNMILKRVFSDKVIKVAGEFTGLTPELEKELKPLNYSFSAIPALLSIGRN